MRKGIQKRRADDR